MALHEDEVLWVVPGSHIHPATPAQDEVLRRKGVAGGRGSCQIPLPGAIQVKLQPGDGVAYASPGILHWGSNYSTAMRRTIHGGFSVLGYNSELKFLDAVAPSTRAKFTQWADRNADIVARQEGIFRAVLGGGLSASAYERMVGELVPTHSGELSRRHTHICLSKAVRCAGPGPLPLLTAHARRLTCVFRGPGECSSPHTRS